MRARSPLCSHRRDRPLARGRRARRLRVPGCRSRPRPVGARRPRAPVAAQRRSRAHRCRRLRLADGAREGADHPRRPQHRPPHDRGGLAVAPRRGDGSGRGAARRDGRRVAGGLRHAGRRLRPDRRRARAARAVPHSRAPRVAEGRAHRRRIAVDGDRQGVQARAGPARERERLRSAIAPALAGLGSASVAVQPDARHGLLADIRVRLRRPGDRAAAQATIEAAMGPFAAHHIVTFPLES